MRYAIFGDIHANLEALEVVLADARAHGVAEFVCLGDVVGYNANPRECLQLVRDLGCPVVKGNHDEEACNERQIDGLNPYAEEALNWTRNQLSADDKGWLSQLRLVRQIRDFTAVHATLDSPGAWGYVMNRFDAMASFAYQFTPVCFCGHSHVAGVFVKADRVFEAEPTSFAIEPAQKYFVNVGSVGQPRDGDWRASYVIYDPEEKHLVFRRLEYDLATAQKKIRAAGLPEMLAERLAVGS
ncbi:MAG: metallophosphoesterase family protein [Verrucomicrobiota bacterium]